MWLSIMSFIGGPVISGLINAYQLHLKTATDDKTIAANLAAQEIAAQTAETQIQAQVRIAEIGHPFEPDKIMGYCVAIYLAKLLIWDKVMGWGVTDPLGGFAQNTADLIVGFYFAKRGFENIARIIKR